MLAYMLFDQINMDI